MRRINWLGGTHAPPLISGAPIENPLATYQSILPVYPSADSLTYNSHWAVYAASTGTVDVNLEESTTYGGTYTGVAGFPHTMATITGGQVGTQVFDAALSPSTRFLRFTALNGAGNVQTQGFLCAPKKRTTLTAGPKPSGAVYYDDSALTANGPIHTEYWTRAQDTTRAIYSDRRQCIWSFCQTTGTPRHGFTATGAKTSFLFGLAGYDMPDPSLEVDVTVKIYAYDTGSPEGNIVVGQVGSDKKPVVLAADDTAREGTLTLVKYAPPAIYALVKDPNGTIYPRYVVVEWTPSIGSDIPIIGSPAPPPLRGYLVALDSLTKEACLRPYAGAGVVIDSGRAGGTYWHHIAQVGPGIKALQPWVTISRDNLAGAGTPAEFWATDSGATAADKILVESPQSGAVVFPPKEWAEVSTNQGWDATPTGTGTYRMAEIDPDREPTTQLIYGRYYAGFGYRSIRYYPPESLP